MQGAALFSVSCKYTLSLFTNLLLKDQPNGTFLVRESDNARGSQCHVSIHYHFFTN